MEVTMISRFLGTWRVHISVWFKAVILGRTQLTSWTAIGCFDTRVRIAPALCQVAKRSSKTGAQHLHISLEITTLLTERHLRKSWSTKGFGGEAQFSFIQSAGMRSKFSWKRFPAMRKYANTAERIVISSSSLPRRILYTLLSLLTEVRCGIQECLFSTQQPMIKCSHTWHGLRRICQKYGMWTVSLRARHEIIVKDILVVGRETVFALFVFYYYRQIFATTDSDVVLVFPTLTAVWYTGSLPSILLFFDTILLSLVFWFFDI